MSTRHPVLFMALPVLFALGLAACGDGKKAEQKEEGRPVMVEMVRFDGHDQTRSFVASIRPRVETDLGFRVSGKVAKRLVDVGAEVRAGQALALLDDVDLTLQREQALAEVAAAKSALSTAEADEKRVSDLRKRGWSTESTFDRQRAAADEALGRFQRAQKTLALAENALKYATLMADTDGTVVAVTIEPGQVVQAGQAAIRVAKRGEKEALVAVPESLVERIRAGKASLTLWSQPDKVYAAQLRELAPSADPATRTYQARFSIPQAGSEVQLGMTATVTVVQAGAEKLARLPLSAILNQNGEPAVYTVDPASGLLTLRPIAVAGYESRHVLVRSGLNEGDTVVALGAHKLDPKGKVRIIKPSSQAKTVGQAHPAG
jgi:RND family efflux transporter MFP subunit